MAQIPINIFGTYPPTYAVDRRCIGGKLIETTASATMTMGMDVFDYPQQRIEPLPAQQTKRRGQWRKKKERNR